MPLLIGIDGTEDTDRNHWVPGTKVKAIVSFNPYHVDSTDGVSASVKVMVVLEEAKAPSLMDRATALFAAYGDEE